MKGYACLLAAGLALGLWTGAAAYPGEPDGFGDMRWGDSVKKVSERYASQYLEDTLGAARSTRSISPTSRSRWASGGRSW